MIYCIALGMLLLQEETHYPNESIKHEPCITYCMLSLE